MTQSECYFGAIQHRPWSNKEETLGFKVGENDPTHTKKVVNIMIKVPSKSLLSFRGMDSRVSSKKKSAR